MKRKTRRLVSSQSKFSRASFDSTEFMLLAAVTVGLLAFVGFQTGIIR